MTTGARCREDAGLGAIDMFVTVIIAMVPMFVLVLSIPSWVERLLFARAAAQEAARVVVLADTWEDGRSQAQAVVDELAGNHDLPSGAATLALSGERETSVEFG